MSPDPSLKADGESDSGGGIVYGAGASVGFGKAFGALEYRRSTYNVDVDGANSSDLKKSRIILSVGVRF
jgi:hypothetical protein